MAVLAVALLVWLAAGAAVPAEAAKGKLIVKNGTAHACYKAKGKSRGSVRLVGERQRCKQGERKLRWAMTGPVGARGAPGAGGAAGSPGPAGAPGSAGSSSTTTLETKVTMLTTQVETLEQTLAGVTNAALTEALAALNDVDALCTQATALTTQVNSLATVIGGLGLNGVLTSLGGLLSIPALPAALSPFTCPA